MHFFYLKPVYNFIKKIFKLLKKIQKNIFLDFKFIKKIKLSS